MAPGDGLRDAGRRRGAAVLAAALYLGVGVALWWHLWAHGLGGALASGSLDPGQDVWWLAWVPHALGAGMNPFFTHAMYHPAGVNVVANTSFLLLALVLSPVTVIAGPLAGFAVAVILVPAADAVVAFFVFRRYVQWQPAAFAGGLVFGFGPFVGTDLRFGHLNLTLLVLLPVGLVLVERILVDRRGSPARAGAALAAVIVAQFFVSAEILALAAVVAAAAAVIVVASRGRRWRTGLGYTTSALAVTVAVSGAVLAYPLWWYLKGPRHFNGAVWGNMGRFSASLAAFVQPGGELLGVRFISGGNGVYLGVPLIVVLFVGAGLWWRDRRLRLATAMVLVSAILALGQSLHLESTSRAGAAMPAWPLWHLPLLSSSAADRFGAFIDLFAALGLTLVLDRARRQLSVRGARPHIASLSVAAVAGLAVIPLGLVPPWPYPAHRVVEPMPLQVLAELPAGTVVREYPLAQGTDADGLAWQAQSGIRYSVTAGYAIVPGPGGRASIAPPTDTVGLAFVAASLGRLQWSGPSLPDAVRAHAFSGGVKALAVVTPSPGCGRLLALLRAALGPPDRQDRSGALWLAPR